MSGSKEATSEFAEKVREVSSASLNKPFWDAKASLARLGYSIRVTRRDGKPQVVTMNVDRLRANVWVVDGIVTRLDGIG